MASEKQIQANRRNAQRSTGPVTAEGKAAVSQNALKHGLRSRGPLVPPTDEELQPLRDRVIAEWKPQSEDERVVLEQMAVILHQQARFKEMEAMWDSHMLDPEFVSALDILSRRQAALARNYHQAIRSLLILRLHLQPQ
jgi:hypothetical protein